MRFCSTIGTSINAKKKEKKSKLLLKLILSKLRSQSIGKNFLFFPLIRRKKKIKLLSNECRKRRNNRKVKSSNRCSPVFVAAFFFPQFFVVLCLFDVYRLHSYIDFFMHILNIFNFRWIVCAVVSLQTEANRR